MHKHSLSLSIMIVGALVAVLHVTALNLSLYFVYQWFDILVHFLMGVFLSMVGVWFYRKFRREALFNNEHLNALFNIIIFVTIAGLFWETFELAFELTLANRALYIKDTILDFIMNIIGAIFGFIYAKWLIKNI